MKLNVFLERCLFYRFIFIENQGGRLAGSQDGLCEVKKFFLFNRSCFFILFVCKKLQFSQFIFWRLVLRIGQQGFFSIYIIWLQFVNCFGRSGERYRLGVCSGRGTGQLEDFSSAGFRGEGYLRGLSLVVGGWVKEVVLGCVEKRLISVYLFFSLEDFGSQYQRG